MSIETKSMHITPAGGNVFADLGFEPKEAAALKAESQRIIAEKLAIKESLMAELAGWIEVKKLKQAEAAEILGVTRPRVSDVIHKKTIKFTIDALVDMLARTGKHVQLSVQ
jgi:predicted XRE-type DNA-binding protein